MRWLKRSEAAEALGIPPRRVRTLAEKGTIPFKYVGRLKFYGISEEEESLEEQKEGFFEKNSDK